MPLKTFIEDQIEQIYSFLAFPVLSMRVIQYDPDVKQLLMKILVRMDEDENNPHIIIPTNTSFNDEHQFFADVLKEVSDRNEAFRSELAEVGVELPRLPDEEDGVLPCNRFAQYVSSVADCLPDSVGAYAVLFDPEAVNDERGFADAMMTLAEQTASSWAKYMVLDRRQNPILGDIDQRTERVSIQAFYLSPEQIEQQVKADLSSGFLSPAERRQYTAMTAAFAAANRNYREAEKIQLQCLEMAENEGTPAEQANALYNLGNTYLETKQFAEAQGCLTRAAEICIENNINPMLAMVLTNLGVILQREGQINQSMESFAVAQRTFKAINNRPGEAHVLDCKASTLALDKRNAEAEQAWLEALAIYDSITSDMLQDVRNSGRNDIIDKLKRFYESTNQPEKIKSLESQGGPTS